MFYRLAALLLLLSLPSEVFSETSGECAEYHQIELQNPYRAIHVITVQRNALGEKCEMFFTPGAHGFAERERLSSIVSRLRRGEKMDVVAAQNGTFLSSDPGLQAVLRGPFIQYNELSFLPTRDPTHPALLFSENGNIEIGVLDIHLLLQSADGESRELGLNTSRSGAEGVLFTPLALGRNPGGPDDHYSIPRRGGGRWYLLAHKENKVSRIVLPASGRTERRLGPYRVAEVARRGLIPHGDELVLYLPDEEEGSLNEQLPVFLTLQRDINPSTGGGDCFYKRRRTEFSSISSGSGAGRMLLLKSENGEVRIPRHLQQVAAPPAPLSGVCWNDDELRMVVADGKRPGLSSITSFLPGMQRSAGMSEVNFAKFMRDNLGCQCGIGLDGGRVATLYFDDGIRNSPATGLQSGTAGALILTRLKR